MTGDTLCRWHIRAETKIANKSSNCHGKHDPSVVCHKQKPVSCQVLMLSTDAPSTLHYEEAVEDLQSVENAFDNLALSLGVCLGVSSYNQP